MSATTRERANWKLESVSDKAFEGVEDIRGDFGYDYQDAEFRKLVEDWLGADFYDYYVQYVEEGEES